MLVIKCRKCGKQINYRTRKPCSEAQRILQGEDAPYFPFCSRRCKMVDLGMWFSEEYRISAPLPSREEEDKKAEE